MKRTNRGITSYVPCFLIAALVWVGVGILASCSGTDDLMFWATEIPLEENQTGTPTDGDTGDASADTSPDGGNDGTTGSTADGTGTDGASVNDGSGTGGSTTDDGTPDGGAGTDGTANDGTSDENADEGGAGDTGTDPTGDGTSDPATDPDPDTDPADDDTSDPPSDTDTSDPATDPGLSDHGTVTDPADLSPPDTSTRFFHLFRPDGEGWIRFATNDTSKVDQTNGSAWWWADENATISSSDTTASVELVRVAGSATYWYGAIFAPGDTRSLNDFIAVTITTTGLFAVYQYHEERQKIFGITVGVKNEWVTVKEPQFSTTLNRGFKTKNTITATYHADGTLSIAFDGQAPAALLSVGNYSAGLGAGLYAGVHPTEAADFPSDPVDIRYRILEPYQAP